MSGEQFAMKRRHVLDVVRCLTREVELVIEANLVRAAFQYALHVGIFKLMELD